MKSPNSNNVTHETFSTGVGLHLVELLAKGVLWESLNNPGFCQDYRLLSTNRWQS